MSDIVEAQWLLPGMRITSLYGGVVKEIASIERCIAGLFVIRFTDGGVSTVDAHTEYRRAPLARPTTPPGDEHTTMEDAR